MTARSTLGKALLVAVGAALLVGCVPLPPTAAPTTAPVAPVDSSTPGETTEPATTDPTESSAPVTDAGDANVPADWTACSTGIIDAELERTGSTPSDLAAMPGAQQMGLVPICYFTLSSYGITVSYAYFTGVDASAQTIESALSSAGWDISGFGSTLFGSQGETATLVGAGLDPTEDAPVIQALGAGNDVLRIMILWGE